MFLRDMEWKWRRTSSVFSTTLGIGRAHVVGYSMGAALAGYLLVNEPDRLITVTLGGGSPRLSTVNHTERAKRVIELLEEQARTADSSDGQDYEALTAIPLSWSQQGVAESELAASRVPTLAMLGSEDPRLSGVKELRAMMPNVQVFVIDGATHSSREESGALGRPEFGRAVYSFVSSH